MNSPHIPIKMRRFKKRRPASGRIRRERHFFRRGVLSLELVLVLPLILIALLATVQFGKYFANLQELAFATRVGAEEAAKTSGLSNVEGDPVPTNVVQAIDHQLAAFGLSRRIIVLEHNIGGTPVSLVEPTGAPAPTKLSPVPPGRYVRILITVPKADVMPELLKVFGLHLAGGCKTTTLWTVWAYEK
ncbi:MAG: TadE/TadG family type IV pilus assembly protein [Thermogutta sp.]